MKAFDFNRFLNVARWDITINRKFYIRQIVVIAGCVLIPVIFRYLKAVYSYLMMSDSLSFSEYKSIAAIAFHDVDSYSYYFNLLFLVAMVQMLCYAFHNLATKQGRINELTLPATNQERFAWHIVCKVLGTFLVFMASILLADLVHVILGWAMFGITDPHSLTCATWRLGNEDSFLINFNGTAYARFGLECFISFLGLSFYTTFLLGSALKYKHTFGYVLLFHVVFWIVSVILFGIGACVIAHMNFCDLTIFCEVPEWLQSLLLNIPVLAVLCAMWWLTYRLYCRAQITTRRNP